MDALTRNRPPLGVCPGYRQIASKPHVKETMPRQWSQQFETRCLLIVIGSVLKETKGCKLLCKHVRGNGEEFRKPSRVCRGARRFQRLVRAWRPPGWLARAWVIGGKVDRVFSIGRLVTMAADLRVTRGAT